MEESPAIIDIPSQPPALLAPPRRNSQREKRFTDAVIVKRLDGNDVSVPMSQEGVRNANIITAELCRDTLERILDSYKTQDKVPTTKEMNELVSAAKSVAEMAKAAHEGGSLGAPGPDGLLADGGGTVKTPDQFLTLMARISSVAPAKNVTPK